jgi:ADP-heptose:LPS heptosyltransferase
VPKVFHDPREGKTLVLCPIGIGNFIMATPALKALSEALGPGRVSLLALKSGIAAMGESSGLFGEVLAWDPDKDGLRRGLSLLHSVRAQKFTHSLALFPSSHWKFSLFDGLTGAAFRMGFRYPHQRAPEWIQDYSIPLRPVHDTLQNLQLVSTFLRDPVEKAGAPFLPFAALAPEGLPATPFFACHPGSSAERGMGDKRLPPEVFSSWIRSLHQATGWPCVLVGGPEEHALRAAVALDCKDALVKVDTRSIEETAGVLRGAKFFLGNDSGLMHIAAAAGTRCASYFGPTDERRTGPYGYWETVDGPKGPSPRHLILRRPGKAFGPAWTLDTVGLNPPLDPHEGGAARWYPDVPATAAELQNWVESL